MAVICVGITRGEAASFTQSPTFRSVKKCVLVPVRAVVELLTVPRITVIRRAEVVAVAPEYVDPSTRAVLFVIELIVYWVLVGSLPKMSVFDVVRSVVNALFSPVTAVLPFVTVTWP